MKHYAKRDLRALGQHYGNHVSAMTGEGLELKSEVAAELAHRDAEIERRDARIASLEAEVATLRRERDEARAEQMTDFQHDTQILDALQSEVDALRAKLAAAQSIRLGRAPTVEEVEKHVGLSWLVWLEWESEARPHVIRGTDPERQMMRRWIEQRCIIDAIFLDTNGQPCPCGGWGGAQ